MSNPPIALASKKNRNLLHMVTCTRVRDPPYQLSSQVPTKHSSVTNIPGARHYIKVTFFLFPLGRSQKKMCRQIVFSPDKIYSMSSMEGSLV